MTEDEKVDPLRDAKRESDLRSDIEHAINKNCAENGSNTPDFVLAQFLMDSLAAFDRATNRREDWHGNVEEDIDCGWSA